MAAPEIIFGTSGGNRTLTEPYVGTSGGNRLIVEIIVGTASGNKIVFGTTADVTPNAVNWADISGATSGTNANQTINGTSVSITISAEITGGAFNLNYSLAGGGFTAYTAPISVNGLAGQTLRWQASTDPGIPASGTVTIRNDSDGSATLDTFTVTLSG